MSIAQSNLRTPSSHTSPRMHGHTGAERAARELDPRTWLLSSMLIVGSAGCVGLLLVSEPMPAIAWELADTSPMAAPATVGGEPAPVVCVASDAAHESRIAADCPAEAPIPDHATQVAASEAGSDEWRELVLQARAGENTAARTDAVLRAAQFPAARDECVAIALENLHDQDPEWRIAALTVLRDLDTTRFAPEFGTSLSDAAPAVRSTALFALSRFRDWSSVPAHVRSQLVAHAEQSQDQLELRGYCEMFAWVEDVWFQQALANAGDRLNAKG